ncbi:hypothetical protein [Paraglaciecola hydrolytica]|uniref:Spore coat protein U domain-containing protein n=1 Tax=Paraglaciecola hydrolytica TaxID=1799789 RepID=A0A148KMW1_9ALTE|nr:hypothetical protein [Paraglaciecola hydrolytica]KXI27656.1 hypothetical protein AX660_19050 [Paraglaciecola hydrolytica]
MQPNKTKLALQIGAVVLGALCASNVYAATFTATVTTIDDVTIAQRASYPLTFGSNMFTQANTSCTLQVGGTSGEDDHPGGLLMRHSHTSGTPQGADFGVLEGDGCVNTAIGVTPGIWDISGIPGGSVSILITQVAQSPTTFTYSPDEACYVSYSGGTVDDADDCLDLVPGNVVTARLPVSGAAEADTTSIGANGGVAQAGLVSIAVGGTVAIGAVALDPSAAYNLAFQIDVTY